jgi:hypothetical protein
VQARPLPTDAQLRAHEGAAAPRGWVPVDLGDARIWVPPIWRVETEEDATECGDFGQRHLPVDGLLGLGFAGALCPRHPNFKPRQSGSLVLSAARPAGAPYRTINGYRVYRPAPTRDAPSTSYEVPELGVRIALNGSLATRVLDTLAPSSERVALAYATKPVPARYRNVTTDRVALAIPSSWTVVTPSYTTCYWPVSPNGAPELVRVHPGGRVACGPTFGYTAFLPNDGVSLVSSGGANGIRRGRRAIARLRHGSSTVTVYPGSSIFFQQTVDVFVRRDGSPTTHVLTLGLGPDGRVAGAVLASLHATA